MFSNTESSLKVTGVDFLKSQNTRQHHTDGYNIQSLVVRRGQPFQVLVSLSRELRAADKLTLRFGIGESPMKNRGSLLSLKPEREDFNGWKISVVERKGKECLLSVTSSPNAPVGKYNLHVKTGSNIYKPENGVIYLLFNPWCEDDVVYMANDAEKEEYVLNDTGTIYVGSAYSIYDRPWNFGQFEEFVLDACMYLLDKSKLSLAQRRDPAHVSRAMSALVNANDDSGVLLGNWSGNYVGGTSPMDWIGSVTILQKYYKTKKPVCYGQCWVFSGVLTTVMRCLGVPCRCVSTFDSAHDTEENLRVDVYLNDKGEKLNSLSFDSVWNFHVWNDAWMKRTDIPDGFSGWQAIDSTPQEQSEGRFQCGPCPVKAVREGDVYLPYDAKFVYAEVNADRVYWVVKKVNGKDKYFKVGTETQAIGKNISTKAVGQNRRVDITQEYKYPEGSKEERMSMQRAYSFLRPSGLTPRSGYASTLQRIGANTEPLVPNEPVTKTGLHLEITNTEPLHPGNPLEMAITVKTSAPGNWTIDLIGSCQLQYYTGNVQANLGTLKETITLEGPSEMQIPLKIAPDAYMKTLSSVEDEVLILVTAIAEVQETNDKLTKETSMRFEYPPITVQMPETASLYNDFNCAFIFKNKLNVTLENCKLLVEGLGIFKMTTFELGDIMPGRIIKSEIVCTPTRLGEKKIVAKLISNQIKGISTEKGIFITE
ncbi:protein-glutamine gamma-glutamyltransferase 4 isoform X2 [Camarhynchus parvulus]|uniref:protein-glutamine gamma-glutamyltransferase 4 isoform X2 n=1 Tax=Geospiza parvula TaxID=87175 RepID=UPI0003954EA0|nr:protein-glutamine gamma-glutamyltransferase 4 isoform X2 [Camarhynchus parvulus]